MNTAEGRVKTILQVNSFTLKLNEDVYLHNMKKFNIAVEFEYWAATPAKDFEEPETPEYIELYRVSTINDVYLTDSRGIMVHISGYSKLIELLSEKQYNKICDALSLKQEVVCL